MTRIVIPGYNCADDDYAKQILDAMWPKDVERPVVVEVDRDRWNFSGAYAPVDFFPERDADYGDGPVIVVTMSNGAELVVEEIDPSQQESALEEFRGEWVEYSAGDKETLNAILDTAYEILARAVSKASLED